MKAVFFLLFQLEAMNVQCFLDCKAREKTSHFIYEIEKML